MDVSWPPPCLAVAPLAVVHRERHGHVADSAELPREIHLHLEMHRGLLPVVEDFRVAVASLQPGRVGLVREDRGGDLDLLRLQEQRFVVGDPRRRRNLQEAGGGDRLFLQRGDPVDAVAEGRPRQQGKFGKPLFPVPRVAVVALPAKLLVMPEGDLPVVAGAEIFPRPVLRLRDLGEVRLEGEIQLRVAAIGSSFFRCSTKRVLPSGRPSCFGGRIDRPDINDPATPPAVASDSLLPSVYPPWNGNQLETRAHVGRGGGWGGWEKAVLRSPYSGP